jgi:hypothetical protein
MLETQGYDASIISMDKSPEGYLTLRSAMNDQRIGLLQIELLEKELIELQRDVQTGKLDHPSDGSKDMADSLAGALLNATKHKQSLLDSMQLLSTFADVNTDIDARADFISDLEQSISYKRSQEASNVLDNLMNNYGDSNMLIW